MDEIHWTERVKQAELYLKLGQKRHYIYSQGNDYPWEFASKVEGGGSHRLDISTSLRFTAEHPSGLEFSWCFDIEADSANGKGHYDIQTDKLALILKKVLPACARQMRSHFASYIAALEENARKYEEVAARERRMVADLRRLQ